MFMPTRISEASPPALIRRVQRPVIHERVNEDGTRSPEATNNSSMTKGIASARENGHPTMAPVANKRVAYKARWGRRKLEGATDAANAAVVVYMANEDGRNAG